MKKSIYILAAVAGLLWVSSALAAVEVFVSIPPQKWLTESVGKELARTGVLVGEGQDPHTFEPTPKQIVALSRARIWFTMGMDFEKQLIRKVTAVAPELKIIDIAAHVEKIAMQDNAHGNDDEHDAKEHGHGEHEGSDPHVWLSPVNLQLMAAEVAKGLSAEDGANSEQFAGNLKRTQDQLHQLHERIKNKLAPYKGASVYVFHPSFGYFTHEYGLVQEPVEIEGKSPGPRQLARLISRAKADKVKVIFVQPQFDPKSAKAVAAAIGGSVVPLDALAEDVAENLVIMAEKIESALAGN